MQTMFHKFVELEYLQTNYNVILNASCSNVLNTRWTNGKHEFPLIFTFCNSFRKPTTTHYFYSCLFVSLLFVFLYRLYPVDVKLCVINAANFLVIYFNSRRFSTHRTVIVLAEPWSETVFYPYPYLNNYSQ